MLQMRKGIRGGVWEERNYLASVWDGTRIQALLSDSKPKLLPPPYHMLASISCHTLQGAERHMPVKTHLESTFQWGAAPSQSQLFFNLWVMT